MSYENPILPGFYPDPSICRVDDDYFLVNSSFEYFPGIPVWHSRDLVNWRQIGNALDRRSQLELGRCKCSDGIYAPTIRHHDSMFFLITTLVTGGAYRNFYVTATRPAGPWSEPVLYDQSGIDPSLFFDDDGKVYFQSNRGMSFEMPRAIYQSEVDIMTGHRLTEPRVIWSGSGGCYVEGPHLYKRKGWYYLLTAEGGTAYGHMAAIARSRSPWGPFESCPHNPILSNRHAYEQLHGTGHGDLVEAADGSWWMVHLAFRKTVDDIHTLGRETCLSPVEWIDDWPVVNGNGTIGHLVSSVLPAPVHAWPEPPARDDFDEPSLAFAWIHLRTPDPADLSLAERPGWLRLKGNARTLDELAAPAFAGQRQRHFAFRAHTRLDFEPGRAGDEAGITLLMTNEHHYDFFVTQREGRRMLVVRFVLELIRHTAAEIAITDGPVDLRVEGTKSHYAFAWSSGGDFHEIARANTRYLGTEVTGGYNGVILGLYATGSGVPATAPADFDFFEYLPGELIDQA